MTRRPLGKFEVDAMRPIIITVVPVIVHGLGETCSTPGSHGSPVPYYPVVAPHPIEHPERITTPTAETLISPLEPGNGSTLAI